MKPLIVALSAILVAALRDLFIKAMGVEDIPIQR
jgi:hypothetical protein